MAGAAKPGLPPGRTAWHCPGRWRTAMSPGSSIPTPWIILKKNQAHVYKETLEQVPVQILKCQFSLICHYSQPQSKHVTWKIPEISYGVYKFLISQVFIRFKFHII